MLESGALKKGTEFVCSDNATTPTGKVRSCYKETRNDKGKSVADAFSGYTAELSFSSQRPRRTTSASAAAPSSPPTTSPN